MADKERLDIISSAIAGLLKRQDAIEDRLARIERALALAENLPERSKPEPEPLIDVQPLPAGSEPLPPVEALPLPLETSFGQEPPSAPPPDRSDGLETEMGLRWVNRIGAFTLVLAVAFFFKLAVDNEWIGPAGRVILGALAGFATLAVADLLWKRGHVVYAQGVSGMGVAVLYLAFYASFGFYQLVPHLLAFLLMVSCTALACALALRYNASAIAMLGLLGGYATPLLLSTGENRTWVFFGYILLLNIAAVWLDRLRSWRRLTALSMAATVFLYQQWWDRFFSADERVPASVFDVAYYALYATIPWGWFGLIAQALATVTAALIWEPEVAPFAGLILGLSAAGMVLADRHRRHGLVRVAIVSSWVAYGLIYSSLRAPVPTGAMFAVATGLYLLFFAWTPLRVFYRGTSLEASDLASAAANTTAYFAAAYALLRLPYHGSLGLFAVALAGVNLALGVAVFRRRGADPATRNAVLVYGAIALTLLTLAIPIQFSGFRITMAWMLEAAALAWIGRRAGAPRFVDASLVVFLLGCLRLFAIDSSTYVDPGTHALVWNARFLTFVVSATALWFGAWSIRPERRALAPYLTGHLVLSWILTQEVLTWAQRVSPPESVWNAQSAAVSILWAIYAVCLVLSGVLLRFGLNRILGLALMGVVVLKLYIIDVWQLRLAYRVASFAALGVLLLATSFLYSKYRESIATWWRDDQPKS